MINSLVKNLGVFNPFRYNYNPVIWVVWLLGLISILVLCHDLFSFHYHTREFWFSFSITVLIWSIILIVNLSENILASHLKKNVRMVISKHKVMYLKMVTDPITWKYELVSYHKIKNGSLIVLEKGDEAPFDCTVVDGTSYVEELLGSGESQGMLVGKHKDMHTLNAGARVVSDKIMVRCILPHEIEFLGSIIRQFRKKKQTLSKELCLTIYLLFLSLISCIQALALSLLIHNNLIEISSISSSFFSWNVIITLCICTLPTTIGALLTYIDFTVIKKLLENKVIITNSKALEKINDIDYIFFDKTGVLTKGNRAVAQIYPTTNALDEFLNALFLSSFSDNSLEGRQIIKYLAEMRYKFDMSQLGITEFIPFDTEKRVSSCISHNQTIVKGPLSALEEGKYIDLEDEHNKIAISEVYKHYARNISIMVIVKNGIIMGYVLLKDEQAIGIKKIFNDMQNQHYELGIITGDNAYNTSIMAAELNANIFYSDVKELDKGRIIEEMQAQGHKIMFIGDNYNDRIALLKADVGICFGRSDFSVKKCADIIDFNNSILKLPEIVALCKQGLTIKGAINIFSMFSDIAKYIAIMPSLFADFFPKIKFLNFMHLSSPETALLSALAFNSIIILIFLPLISSNRIVTALFFHGKAKNILLVYSLLGVFLPFIVIKILDTLLAMF